MSNARPSIIAAVLLLLAIVAGHVKAAPTTQPAASPHIVRITDVRYGEGPDRSNLLDLYLPDHIDRPLPLVVWVHGGGWSAGDKTACPGLPLVVHGFVVASLNYRLTSVAIYPAQIQDCKGAIRFLRAHAREYHIDPSRIGVWGASAGGHLVALLGSTGGSVELEGRVGGNLNQSSRVQAVCDWFGPTDLTQFADQALAAGIVKTTPGPSLIMKLFGGSLKEKKDLVQLANPIAFVLRQNRSSLPPFLIMHGDKDKLVPVAQSQMLCDALKTAGASVDMRVVAGAGHGGSGFFTPAVSQTVLNFFTATLK